MTKNGGVPTTGTDFLITWNLVRKRQRNQGHGRSSCLGVGGFSYDDDSSTWLRSKIVRQGPKLRTKESTPEVGSRKEESRYSLVLGCTNKRQFLYVVQYRVVKKKNSQNRLSFSIISSSNTKSVFFLLLVLLGRFDNIFHRTTCIWRGPKWYKVTRRGRSTNHRSR